MEYEAWFADINENRLQDGSYLSVDAQIQNSNRIRLGD
jgi:hypothetical protein